MRRAWAIVAVLAAGVLLAPAAQAALAFRDCPDADGFECTTVKVPRDRADPSAGTIQLRVARELDAPLFARIPLLALSGGPGQPGVAFGPLWQAVLDGVQSRYAIVLVDVRGTGRSGLLRCPELQRQGLTDVTVRAPGTVEACARRLGPARDAYATTETVEDLDAVRAALGAPKMALLGVSYGTYYALRYARAHPDRVDRLILDSVVPQENVGLDLPATWPALRGLLTALCGGSRCRAITPDPVADLASTLGRLRAGPLTAPIFDGRGRSRVARIADPRALYDVLLGAALDDQLRAALPAALAAASRGDAVPLVRAAQRSRSLVAPPLNAETLDWAVHAATLCADLGQPSAYGLLAPDVVAPFTPEEAAANGLHDMCGRWPPSRAALAPAPGPLPDVPTLILSGQYDALTPLTDARREAGRSPRAEVVVVPGVGHSAITDVNDCARAAVVRFVRGRPAGLPCRRSRATGTALDRAYPLRLADVAPAPGVPGRGGVAVAIALRTFEDTIVLADVYGSNGALRGGTVSYLIRPGGGLAMRAKGAQLLLGVRVDGTRAPEAGGTRLRVRGQGLSATFTIDPARRVRGTVDGKPFSGRLPKA